MKYLKIFPALFIALLFFSSLSFAQDKMNDNKNDKMMHYIWIKK